MGEMLTVITINEDGDVRIELYEKEVLLERLNDGYWGESIKFADISTLIEEKGDPMEWRPGGCVHMVILRGEPVVPSQVPMRTEYTLS